MLAGLAREGFTDDQVLFTYRTFNSFLLGYLLLETSAMALRDPQPGDGSFTGPDTIGDDGGGPAGQAASAPVIGGLSPVRTAGQRQAIEDADSAGELLDPADAIDARRYPTLHRLAAGLAEDRWDGEFDRGLEDMLDRIAVVVAGEPAVRSN
jgi:TetR/AcrR family transcriptional regulator, tetracycline repressor protein